MWTVPVVDERSTTYWGSVDARIFALDAAGEQLWQRTTLGYVTSSPAMDTSGVLYQGSFDGSLYALDRANGSVRWKYQTGDHIYSSPALIEDADGTLQQVVIGSTDGLLHSLSPDGQALWTYDTGAPIRSSPVVGRAPDGRPVVYVGAANGQVVAVDATEGTRRWAFDTTSAEPTLATRNQLNSSPALTADGVVIGSQDGVIWFVPYDYCLRAPGDPRCVPASAELPADGTFVYGVNVGGGLVPQDEAVRISPAGYFTGRLARPRGRPDRARPDGPGARSPADGHDRAPRGRRRVRSPGTAATCSSGRARSCPRARPTRWKWRGWRPPAGHESATSTWAPARCRPSVARSG